METEEENIQNIEKLFLSSHKILCNIANRIVRDRNAAEDIVQEVFLKVWSKRHEIKIESSLKGYLFKAVANGALDYIQKQKKIEFREDIPESEKWSGNTEPSLSQEEMEKKFREALDRLPPKCKAIFVLSRYEGLKHREIAEHLDISIKTVETQISIALDRLRTDLKPYLTREYLPSLSIILFCTIFYFF